MWDENLCWKTEREREVEREGRKRDTLLMVSKNKKQHWHLCVNKYSHAYADVQSDCNVLEYAADVL